VIKLTHDGIEAIGLVEVKYFTTASFLLDVMCKGAGVQFLSSENDLGGRLVTLIVGGGMEDVQAALAIAEQQTDAGIRDNVMNTVLISKPSDEIMKFIGEKRTQLKEGVSNE
jgi:ethanolamine utilization protein EutM